MDFGSFLVRAAAVSLFILCGQALCFPLKPAITIYQDKAENKNWELVGAKHKSVMKTLMNQSFQEP